MRRLIGIAALGIAVGHASCSSTSTNPGGSGGSGGDAGGIGDAAEDVSFGGSAGTSVTDGMTGDASPARALYAKSVLDDGAALYWRQLGASPTVPDESLHGRDGKLSGCVQSAIAAGGPAISLCGGFIEGVDFFDFDGNKPFTFEVWVRLEPQQSDYPRLASKEDLADGGERRGWDVLLNHKNADGNPDLAFERYLTQTPGTPASLIVVDPAWSSTFTHVVVSYDGLNMMRIHLNGAEAVPGKSSGGTVAVTTQAFRVGADPGGTSQLHADVAEIAVYEEALTLAKIQSHTELGRAAGL